MWILSSCLRSSSNNNISPKHGMAWIRYWPLLSSEKEDEDGPSVVDGVGAAAAETCAFVDFCRQISPHTHTNFDRVMKEGQKI